MGETLSITLSGDVARSDHQTYREIPFAVPRGVTRISVELAHSGNPDRTVIDMGLRDPEGQRGWSGSNKSAFTVSEFDATPSYTLGRIQRGTWMLVLGFPNIREGQTAHYEAKVTLDSTPPAVRKEVTLSSSPTLSAAPGWRRGDFHSHTAHSDGSCDNGDGLRIPCPLPHTVEAARDANLDFIAITDHNTLSHRNPMRELQPAFSNLLLIPGIEVTTFYGHANAIGLSEPVEFQLGGPRLPTVNSLLDQVDGQGAILSINHPALPPGDCLGCGWTAPDTDFSRIAAIEVVNGSSLRVDREEGPASGIPFWEHLLDQGHRITAIGGSDNHDAKDTTGQRQSPVGKPTTVVWAPELSERGVLEGVRSGRVFIDLANRPGAVLEAEGRSRDQSVNMGGVLFLPQGVQGHFIARIDGVEDGAIELVSHGLSTVEPDRERPTQVEAIIQLDPSAASGWIRADVRDASDRLLIIGNPVYVQSH